MTSKKLKKAIGKTHRRKERQKIKHGTQSVRAHKSKKGRRRGRIGKKGR